MKGAENLPGYRGPGRDKPPPETRGTGEISESQADQMHAIMRAHNPANDPAIAKKIVDRLMAGLPPVENGGVERPSLLPISTMGQSAVTTTAQPIIIKKPVEFEEDLAELLGEPVTPTAAVAAIVATPVVAPVMQNAPMMGGLRSDDGKTRLELVPPEWPWALADVTTQGTKKYAERNWERGMKWSKMIGCSLRHILKFCLGERYDPETGCHHLAMAAWNCLALMSYDLRTLTGKPVGENDIPAFASIEILEVINSKKGIIDMKKAT